MCRVTVVVVCRTGILIEGWRFIIGVRVDCVSRSNSNLCVRTPLWHARGASNPPATYTRDNYYPRRRRPRNAWNVRYHIIYIYTYTHPMRRYNNSGTYDISNGFDVMMVVGYGRDERTKERKMYYFETFKCPRMIGWNSVDK